MSEAKHTTSVLTLEWYIHTQKICTLYLVEPYLINHIWWNHINIYSQSIWSGQIKGSSIRVNKFWEFRFIKLLLVVTLKALLDTTDHLVKLYAPQSCILCFWNILYYFFFSNFFLFCQFPKFWEFLLFAIFNGIFNIPKCWQFFQSSIFNGSLNFVEIILKIVFFGRFYDISEYSIFGKKLYFSSFPIFCGIFL